MNAVRGLLIQETVAQNESVKKHYQISLRRMA